MNLFQERWRIDLRYFYLFATFSVSLAFLLDLSARPTVNEALESALAVSLSITALYFFWRAMARAVSGREDSTISPLAMISIGAIGGAFQGLLLNFLYLILDVDELNGGSKVILSSVIYAAIWLPAQSLTVQSFTSFQRDWMKIQERSIALSSIELARQRLKQSQEELLNSKIMSMLESSTQSAEKFLDEAISEGSSISTSRAARALAIDHLRVLSHEIMALGQADPRTITPIVRTRKITTTLQAFKVSLRTRALNPILFTLVILATASLPLLRRIDFPSNLLALSAIGVSTYLIQFLGGLLHTPLASVNAIRIIFTNILNAIGTPILISNVIGKPIFENGPQIFLVVLALVTLTGLIAQTGSIRREEFIRTEREALKVAIRESSKINLELATITRSWATHIHGNLQSKLHAYALLLEQAEISGNSERIESSVDDIRRVIMSIKDEVEGKPSQLLLGEIQKRADPWRGLIDIEVYVDPFLQEMINPVNALIGDCVNEAITNAVRHGAATKISISVVSINGKIEVTIANDGSSSANFKPGMGVRVFEDATRGAWELNWEEEKRETRLTLSFDMLYL